MWVVEVLPIIAAGLLVVVGIVVIGLWFGNRVVEAIDDLEDDAP